MINSLVIAEIVWTLESYYGLGRADIKDKIFAIFNTPGLEVAEDELLWPAILWYGDKNVDFIDAFNAAWLLSQGLSATYTFDRKHFSRIEGVKVWMPEN